MRIKIIQADSLNDLEADINAWLEENPTIEVIDKTVHSSGNWRSCYAVLWHRQKYVMESRKEEEGWERTE